MKSRVEGVQKVKHHLYAGKHLLDKETFYEWALADEHFHDLFKLWEAGLYSRKLTPSVDRVDSSKGYHVVNMEWVTHSENSRRGAISKWRSL